MSWISRLFTGGAPPEEFLALVDDPATLYHADHLSSVGRAAHLRAPNRRSSKSVTTHLNGRVALASDGLSVWVGRRLQCRATFTSDEDTAVLVTFRHDGFTIDVDIAKALPPNSEGTLQLAFRATLSEAILAQLPGHQVHATVSELDLLSMTRWA